MKALILGGGGYIGRRLSSRMASEGWLVTTVSLPQRTSSDIAPPKGVRRRFGDRANAPLLDALLGERPDVVVDLIAYKATDTESLVRTAAGRIGRLVHLSTVSVYQAYPSTSRATEQSSTRFTRDDMGYGAEKAACERVLERAAIEEGFPHVILRAAPIMGPGDPCSREGYFLERILAGQPIVHPGPAEGRLWILFVDDLVDALVRACAAPVLGRVFHLALEDAPTLREHLETLAASVGRPTPELRVLDTEELARSSLRIYGFPYARTLDVCPDTGAAQRELLWRATPYREAAAKTVHSLRVEDARTGVAAWPGRGTTQSLLSGVHPWIHAELEARLLARSGPGRYLGTDSVTAWLVGEPGAAADLAMIATDRWQEMTAQRRAGEIANCGPLGGEELVAVPDELRARLVLSGACPGNRQDEDDTNSARATPGQLMAALELDRWNPSCAWLYTAGPPIRPEHYGWSAAPHRIDIVGLSKALERRPRAAERLLVDSHEPIDAALMARHLDRCEEQGMCVVDDIQAWGRIYALGWRRWVPRDPRKATWVLSHAVARLLGRAGLGGAAVIRMEGDAPKGGETVRVHPAAAICRLQQASYLVDVLASRVVEIPTAVARVLTSDARWDASWEETQRAPKGFLCREVDA